VSFSTISFFFTTIFSHGSLPWLAWLAWLACMTRMARWLAGSHCILTRLNTMTICPNYRAKLGIVSSRSCSTRGWVTISKRGVAKKWKRTGEKGIWNYLTRDWFACKSRIRWVLYSLVVYPNISQVIDGSLTLLFVLIKVYVERERGSRRLRARCLTYFCYDILIFIMISMLAAVRDLANWEPVSVRFVNRNSGTEPHFCYHGYVPYFTVFKQHWRAVRSPTH